MAKNLSDNARLLAEDNAKARAMGLTYGKYKALTYTPSEPSKQPETAPNKKHKQEYLKHHNRFVLWKKGYSDEAIAYQLDVSRITILNWRKLMELPSANRCKDRDKYRLIETEYGFYVVDDTYED